MLWLFIVPDTLKPERGGLRSVARVCLAAYPWLAAWNYLQAALPGCGIYACIEKFLVPSECHLSQFPPPVSPSHLWWLDTNTDALVHVTECVPSLPVRAWKVWPPMQVPNYGVQPLCLLLGRVLGGIYCLSASSNLRVSLLWAPSGFQRCLSAWATVQGESPMSISFWGLPWQTVLCLQPEISITQFFAEVLWWAPWTISGFPTERLDELCTSLCGTEWPLLQMHRALST